MDVRKRYLLSVAAVLAAIVAAILGLSAWQSARYSAADAGDRLADIRRAQRLVEQQRNTDIAIRAELLANNQAVVGYIVQAMGESLPGMEQDSASIVDLLQERREQTGLALIAVLDGEGQLVATTERFSAGKDLSDAPLFVQAKERKAISRGLWSDDKRLLHVAVLPLAAYGYNEVYLLVGLPVDRGLARSIAELGEADVVLVADTAEGPLIAASTLAAPQEERLLAELPDDAAEEGFQFRLDGENHYGAISPLFGASSGRLVALVSPRSAQASSAALRLPLLVGGLAVLAIAVLSAWLLWARVLAPVHRLGTIIARAADVDDLYLKAQEGGAAPVDRLAAAFNRLLLKIERRKTRRRPGVNA